MSWDDFPAPQNPAGELVSHVIGKGTMFEERLSYRDVTGYLWGLKSFTDSEGKEVPIGDRPCLVDLHGGPHYFTDAINVELFNLLINSGYVILTVNFSGSWSFGSDFNDRLAGKIGNTYP